MTPEQQMQARAARINSLVGYFGQLADPEVRQKAQELVQLLMELYGAGLQATLGIVRRKDGGGEITEALLRDELISNLLVLHDLHPEDDSTRIRRGLERVRELTGAEIALVDVSDAAARVQIVARRGTRAPAPADLGRLIAEMVQAAAPEVAHVHVEGLDVAPPHLVQLTRAPSGRHT